MHEHMDAPEAGPTRGDENEVLPSDDTLRYATRREGECDVAKLASHGDEAPWVHVVTGTIWDWWERITQPRQDYLDGLPSTLTQQERDTILERFQIDRPFNAMPLDEVVRRRAQDETFGIRYAEFLHRMGVSLPAPGVHDAQIGAKAPGDTPSPRS